jgi:hypothetical protein
MSALPSRLSVLLEPKTLPDAVVQTGLLFYSMDAVLDTDDIEEMRAGVERIERAIARIARIMAREVGVDLTQFGETDLVSMIDHRAAGAVTAEAPT